MQVVVGAFSTLDEAEAAVRALLDTSLDSQEMRAVGRVGGGRLLLAGRVPVVAAAHPARLMNRSERTGAAAVLGGAFAAIVVACLLWLLPKAGLNPLTVVPSAIPDVVAFATCLMVAAAAGAMLAALVRPARGLPDDLAVRYARRLDEGDTVLGVAAASPTEASAIRETLAIQGANQAHVTRGTLEPAGDTAATAEVSGDRATE